MIGKDTNLFVFFFHRVILIVVVEESMPFPCWRLLSKIDFFSRILPCFTQHRSRTVRFSRRSCQVNHFIGAQLHLIPLRILLNPGDGTILLILKVSAAAAAQEHKKSYLIHHNSYTGDIDDRNSSALLYFYCCCCPPANNNWE